MEFQPVINPQIEPAVLKNRKIKRKWGDRKDGVWLKHLDSLHVIQPYVMPNRTECEAFVVEKIDITRVQEYLKKKNAENPHGKYTIFHCIATAIAKTVMLRPKMNRFVQGLRTYQRNELSLAFVAKKSMGDDGQEALMMMRFDEDDSIDTVHNRIVGDVQAVRTGKVEDNSTVQMNFFSKIPRFIMAPIINFIRMLDFYGKVPNFLIKDDPHYSSIFITNLGSIKLHANYHHLNNWGTNSIFVIIGDRFKEPVFDENGFVEMHDMINVSVTLDERIADGYYFSKSLRMFKQFLQNPEILDNPLYKEGDRVE